MFKNLRKAEGFTLIELIVVIAVLLLLMAIALPSFLGVRDKASKAAAKSDLTVALHNAKAEWAENETYPGSTTLVAALDFAEPGLVFEVDDASYDAGVIDVEVAGNVLTLTTEDSKGGTHEYVDTNGDVVYTYTPAP